MTINDKIYMSDDRKMDWTIFKGKVKVMMADPPWDIHMDLPYGTMTDAEMKSLRVEKKIYLYFILS